MDYLRPLSDVNQKFIGRKRGREEEAQPKASPTLVKVKYLKELLGAENVSRHSDGNSLAVSASIGKGGKKGLYFVNKSALAYIGFDQTRLHRLGDNLEIALEQLYSSRKKYAAEIHYLAQEGNITLLQVNRQILDHPNTFYDSFLDYVKGKHPEVETLRNQGIPLEEISKAVVTNSLSELSNRFSSDEERTAPEGTISLEEEEVSDELMPLSPELQEHSSVDHQKLASTILGRFEINGRTATIKVLGRELTMHTAQIDHLVRIILRENGAAPKQIRSSDINTNPVHLITYINAQNERQVALWNGTAIPPKEAPEYLGAGAFGVAQRIYQLTTGEHAVLKAGKFPDAPEGSAKDVASEGFALKSIHSSEIDTSTVQAEPDVVIKRSDDLVDAVNNPIVGYIGPEYDGSVSSLMSSPDRPTGKQLLQSMEDVLKAVVALRKQGLSHGDIKGDNVFYNKHPDGSYQFFLADCGDSKNDSHWQESGRTSAFTGQYYALSDFRARGASLKTTDGASRWIEERDVFATGVMFCLWLSGSTPYPMKEVVIARHKDRTQPDMKSKLNDTSLSIKSAVLTTLEAKYGTQVTSLIQKMLEPNFANRISAEEALQSLRNVLESLEDAEVPEDSEAQNLESSGTAVLSAMNEQKNTEEVEPAKPRLDTVLLYQTDEELKKTVANTLHVSKMIEGTLHVDEESSQEVSIDDRPPHLRTIVLDPISDDENSEMVEGTIHLDEEGSSQEEISIDDRPPHLRTIVLDPIEDDENAA
ncbi:MAG: hypothetical protein Q8K75_10495 [Chlamydiales bacterium]|nr:hypothetical protein [Chlamydiales bacterium]